MSVRVEADVFGIPLDQNGRRLPNHPQITMLIPMKLISRDIRNPEIEPLVCEITEYESYLYYRKARKAVSEGRHGIYL